MANYAVLKIGGKQYLVSPGGEFLVDKLPEGKVEARVLLVVDGEKVTVGKPVLEKAKLNLKIVEAVQKGGKIEIYKYKAKSRYRKHTGFRPQYTRLRLEKISL